MGRAWQVADRRLSGRATHQVPRAPDVASHPRRRHAQPARHGRTARAHDFQARTLGPPPHPVPAVRGIPHRPSHRHPVCLPGPGVTPDGAVPFTCAAVPVAGPRRRTPSPLPEPPTRRRAGPRRTDRGSHMHLPIPPSDSDGVRPPVRGPAEPFPRRAGSQAPFAGVESTLSPFAGPGGPAAESHPASRAAPDHGPATRAQRPDLRRPAGTGDLRGPWAADRPRAGGGHRAGRRTLSRCQVRVAGREPLAVQARMVAADRARFVGTVRASADGGPDPDVVVERTRDADGTERITLRSASPASCACPSRSRSLRISRSSAPSPRAEPGPNCPPASTTRACDGPVPPAARSSPPTHHLPMPWPPRDCSAGSSNCHPVSTHSVELRVRPGSAGRPSRRPRRHEPVLRRPGHRRRPGSRHSWTPASRTSGRYCCATRGTRWTSTWRPARRGGFGLAPADALWAARMRCRSAPDWRRAPCGLAGPPSGPGESGLAFQARSGMPVRICRHLLRASRPGCSSSLLAEAGGGDSPSGRPSNCCPAAERCLRWLRSARPATAGYVPDLRPAARCVAKYRRTPTAPCCMAPICWTPTDVRVARSGAAGRRTAPEFRRTSGSRTGAAVVGRPRSPRTAGPVPHLGSRAAHLLDTGLLGGCDRAGPAGQGADRAARPAPGGPRPGLGMGSAHLVREGSGYNPFGHRGGAVRVQEQAWPSRTGRGRLRGEAAALLPGAGCGRGLSGTGCPRCTRASSATGAASRSRTRPPPGPPPGRRGRRGLLLASRRDPPDAPADR